MGCAIGNNLTKKQLSDILKASKGGSISSKAFNAILQNPAATTTSDSFSFQCSILSVGDDEVHVTFMGRHYSKNDISGWTLRKKLSYKNAIKKSFNDAMIINRKNIPKVPFSRASINVITTLRRSRDDDSEQETSKIMRDCCTNARIIEDDNRKVITKTTFTEVIDKFYSMKLVIKRKSNSGEDNGGTGIS